MPLLGPGSGSSEGTSEGLGPLYFNTLLSGTMILRTTLLFDLFFFPKSISYVAPLFHTHTHDQHTAVVNVSVVVFPFLPDSFFFVALLPLSSGIKRQIPQSL